MKKHVLTRKERFYFLIGDIRLFLLKVYTAYMQVKTARIARRIKELKTIELIELLKTER